MTAASSDPQKTAIVWFRDDLRLSDHEPLTSALRSAERVLACYVLDSSADDPADRPVGARRWWLHESLASLQREIERREGTLVLRRGDPVVEIDRLAGEIEAAAVHCQRSYEPRGAQQEERLRVRLARRSIELVAHRGSLLFEPEAITTRSGEPFKVFTPFWRACLASPDPRPALPVPDTGAFRRLRRAATNVQGDRLEAWGLLPRSPDWSAAFGETWTPGEAHAFTRVERFLEQRLAGYADARNDPATDGTSRLSPHLRCGEISPREVWHQVSSHAATAPSARRGAAAFLREIGWREFSAHVLWHFPSVRNQPLRSAFEKFPWQADRHALRAWQRGLTGYPIVDAGMRELWRTGWMHNRVRMIVASFLVKDLMIDWRCGAEWFLETLVDADLASNAVNWQWVAGSGIDAAPFFRVFNPTLQGRKFDADGAYVRRWLPELGRLPAKHVHAPVAAPAGVLQAAGVRLGETYPAPIVDHGAARRTALAAYQLITS